MSNHQDRASSELNLPARERRERFLAEIGNFCAERRREDALSREQLGELDAFHRFWALRRSLLDNMVLLCRTVRQADVLPALLLLITYFADNNSGACTVSLARLARVLDRSERRTKAALARLVEMGMVLVEERPGHTSLVTPWVRQKYWSDGDHITWWLDAHAPVSRPRGRPYRQTPHDTQHPGFLKNQGRRTSSLSADTHDAMSRGFSEKPMTPVGQTHDAGRHTTSTVEFGEEKKREGAREADWDDHWSIPDELCNAYLDLCKNQSIERSTEAARNNLAEILKSHRNMGVRPDLAMIALRHAIMGAGKTATGSPAKNPFSYVNKVTRSEILRINTDNTLAEQKTAANAKAEAAIADKRVEAYNKAVDAGRVRRTAGGGKPEMELADRVLAQFGKGGAA